MLHLIGGIAIVLSDYLLVLDWTIFLVASDICHNLRLLDVLPWLLIVNFSWIFSEYKNYKISFIFICTITYDITNIESLDDGGTPFSKPCDNELTIHGHGHGQECEVLKTGSVTGSTSNLSCEKICWFMLHVCSSDF